MSKAGSIALRGLKILLLIQLGYLVIVNLALQIPLTQDIVNMVRPDKFHVRWDNAWSWYPFRVHARGVSANGQARSQQWQVDVDAASGSVSVLPLVLKRVYVRNVQVSGVEYRQRPRLKPDKDYTNQLAHFPEIEGREVVPADTSPRKKKRPWKVWINNARADGDVSLWIYNLKGSLSGSAVANLSVESRGGPFSLEARELDLQLSPAYLNGDTEIFNGGTLTGELGFSPFVPRENKGLKMLPYLYLDTLLDLQVKGLAFINLFTGNLGDFKIRGAGRVHGRLNYKEGYVLAGTDLTANADNLSLYVREMDVLGQGTVRISTPAEEDKPLTLAIGYDELAVTRDGDGEPFLSGDSLQIAYGGSNYVVPEPDLDFETFMNDEEYRARRKDNTLLIDIDDATLLNMAIINDYLPPGGGLVFTTGTAQLDADIDARAQHVGGGLQLAGSGVGMEADGQELQGDLAVDLAITGGVPREFRIHLDGSTITLDEVSVAGANQSFDDDKWAATVTFDRAEAVVVNPPFLSADMQLKVSDTRPLVTLFDNHGDPPKWVSKQLILQDIEGQASVELADKRLEVDDAQVLSDKAEIGAKAVFYETGRDGMIYARYKKLDVVLKMQGEKSNLDVFKAREKFDEYKLGQTP